MNSVKKFILVVSIVLLSIIGCNAQLSLPANCELCYSTYYSDQVGLNQCLIDNNCEIDVPIDFGVEFLLFSGFILFFLANKKYKFTN